MTHHVPPLFGCNKCIAEDRSRWAAETFNEWVKTYKPPKCKKCNNTMVPYSHFLDEDELYVVVICTKISEDGCGCGGDIEVKIS